MMKKNQMNERKWNQNHVNKNNNQSILKHKYVYSQYPVGKLVPFSKMQSINYASVAFLLILSFLSKTPTSMAATCGDGEVGDGICAGENLCCSEWGWCGFKSAGHCMDDTGDAATPTISPAPTFSSKAVEEDNSRLVAYLGSWQSCPSDTQVSKYTHIIISFAVSYKYSPGRNICSQTCEISDPAVCDNKVDTDLIANWKAAGKKVILSFGGAGMGSTGNFDNDCWEYCYGRETQVIDRLVEISNNLGLDGIDIDFEYHVTEKAAKFLNEVTVGLKNALPERSLVTHAPMDLEIEPGLPYYDEVLKVSGSALDFLMPQYYNGNIRPILEGIDGSKSSWRPNAIDHYTDLVDGIYGGDSTRVVFGFCIADCSDWNGDGWQASVVMTDLAKTYPCNGGAFFWVAEDDKDELWSTSVSSTIESLASEAQCQPRGIHANPKTPKPTPAPTSKPAPSDPSQHQTYTTGETGIESQGQNVNSGGSSRHRFFLAPCIGVAILFLAF